VNILAIEWRHESPVESLDDVMRQGVALVLDALDRIRGVPHGAIRGEHILEQPRAVVKLDSEGLEV
jgi:hypothetical protein